MTSREDSEVPVQLRSKAVNGEDDLMDEVVQLKIKLSAREDEIKYLERRLSEKEDIIRDMGSKHTLTHKAAISSLWDSLKSLETKVTDNSTNITSVCSRLERITAGLERHSMQGHHLVGSRSAVGLFLKLREGINEIRTLVGTTSKASHRSGENESAALPSSSPSLAAATDHHKADAAFLDLCRYLEDENLRLQQSHVALQRELDALRADAEVAALIPQYRMVIVRWAI
jgi:chromosome segregation ATPase